MAFSFDGKVALVTGGASGIGLAVLKEFLRRGLRGAVIADVDEENGAKAVRELGAGRVLFVKTDVSKGREVEAAFAKAVAEFDNLDVVVNSAGIYRGDDWEKEVGVNLVGTMHSTLLALDKYLPAYKGGDEAVIVNISSVAGLGGIESSPTYCATKHGIVGLSTSLGTENHYRRTGVRVLIICPGGTDTPMQQNTRCVAPQYKKLLEEMRGLFPLQTVKEVVEGVMKSIRDGRNGSIWVVNAGETYEVKLPDLFTLLKR